MNGTVFDLFSFWTDFLYFDMDLYHITLIFQFPSCILNAIVWGSLVVLWFHPSDTSSDLRPIPLWFWYSGLNWMQSLSGDLHLIILFYNCLLIIILSPSNITFPAFAGEAGLADASAYRAPQAYLKHGGWVSYTTLFPLSAHVYLPRLTWFARRALPGAFAHSAFCFASWFPFSPFRPSVLFVWRNSVPYLSCRWYMSQFILWVFQFHHLFPPTPSLCSEWWSCARTASSSLWFLCWWFVCFWWPLPPPADQARPTCSASEPRAACFRDCISGACRPQHLFPCRWHQTILWKPFFVISLGVIIRYSFDGRGFATLTSIAYSYIYQVSYCYSLVKVFVCTDQHIDFADTCFSHFRHLFQKVPHMMILLCGALLAETWNMAGISRI